MGSLGYTNGIYNRREWYDGIYMIKVLYSWIKERIHTYIYIYLFIYIYRKISGRHCEVDDITSDNWVNRRFIK